MNVSYILLGFLETSPNYGYNLKKQYDKYFGKDKPVLTGQVYSTLARLERDKRVKEVRDDELSGGPERIKYEITPQGQNELEAWLNSPESPSPTLQATLYVKTVLALLKDGDAAPYLDNQRRTHIGRMRELTKKRRSVSMAEKLCIDHTLFHIEADLRWIQLTSSRLLQLKEELCR